MNTQTTPSSHIRIDDAIALWCGVAEPHHATIAGHAATAAAALHRASANMGKVHRSRVNFFGTAWLWLWLWPLAALASMPRFSNTQGPCRPCLRVLR